LIPDVREAAMTEQQPSLTLEQKKARLAAALQRQEHSVIEAPLSYSQQRLWFVDQIDPGNPIYNINVTVRITGELIQEKFAEMFQQIAQRQESLRTTFVVRDGSPVQRIAARGEIDFEYLSLDDLPGTTTEQKIQDFAKAHALTRFRIAEGPLVRCSFIKLSPHEHVGCFTTHHIISDGWSIGVMLFEFAALYAIATGRTTRTLPPLRIQYRDYVHWQRQRLEGEAAEELQKFWRSYLEEVPQVLDLPTDRPRPDLMTNQGAIHRFRLPPELCEQVRLASRSEATTQFHYLLAGFAALLSRISGQQELLIGVPVNGRERAELQDLVGYFVNLLPVRIDLSRNPSFKELLHRVRDSMRAAQDHQEIPFDRLVDALQPKRSPGRVPLVQVVYLHQSFPLPDPETSPSLHFAPLEIHPGYSRFELALRTEPGAHGIAAIFEYNTDLFDLQTIARWADQYLLLLQSVLANPSLRLNSIPILTEDERLLLEQRGVKLESSGFVSAHQLRRAAITHVLPQTNDEQRIAAIWADVLGIPEPGIHDDFFEQGGNSLLAMQLVTELRNQFKRDLNLRELFASPTIATAAKLIAAGPPNEMGKRRAGITAAEPEASLVLSSSQQLLYLLEQYEQGLAFNATLAIRIQGDLRVDSLQRSLQRLVERHAILRAAIHFRDGEPVHRIAEQLSVPLERRDYSAESAVRAEGLAVEWARELTLKRFDLSRPPLARFGLAKLGSQSHLLLVAIHHLISDGWSFAILYRDLQQFYAADVERREPSLPHLPIGFTDYAVWQRTSKSEEYDSGGEYWRENFGGHLPLLELPLDQPRGRTIEAVPEVCELHIPQPLADRLMGIGKSEGATPYMVYLAAYLTLLHKLTGQKDLIVGSSTANRLHPETVDLIGFFAGLLPLRCRVEGQKTFFELLQHVKATCLEAFAQPEPRLDDMWRAFRPPGPGIMPLCQTLFTYWDFPNEGLRVGDTEWSLSDLDVVRVSGYDLVLTLRPYPEGLRGALLYRPDLFQAQTVQRFRDYFVRVLQAIGEQPAGQLAEITLLDESERQRLLIEWNRTEHPFPADQSVHQLFAAQVERTPDAVAIRMGSDRAWTYWSLNEFSSRMAMRLVKGGVKRDVLVAVLQNRSPELVGTLLGIWKAGGAYLPLDPAWPTRRLEEVLREVRPAAIVVDQEVGELRKICSELALPILSVSEVGEGPNETPSTVNWNELCAADSLAYVIFTSGSTGTPKGVMIEQSSVVNVIDSFIRTYRLDAADRVLHQASIAFDVSVNEIFPVLCSGGTLIIPEPAQIGDFDQLSELVEREAITIMGATPSGLVELNRRAERLGSLRLVLSGGEALARSHVERLLSIARVTNGYGPTETTVCATYYDLGSRGDEQEWYPIGKPLPNYRVYVLDSNLQPLPVGLTGELLIGGVGLARGYWNDPDLTRRRFLPNPFVPGERIYRTGDEVRWRADGNLEFIGRLDRQVKIRGQRVELGEIEAALSAHPDVIHCAVVCQQLANGEAQLGAFVKLQVGSSLTTGWREYLRDRLPNSMLPSVLLPVEELPLSSNGKVDYSRLPSIPAGAGLVRKPYLAARTADEELMAGIWAEALGLEQVGIDENFFELGGHSLLAAQILYRVEREFQQRLSYRAFFDSQTVEQTVKVIERLRQLPREVGDGTDSLQATRPFTGIASPLGALQEMFEPALPEGSGVTVDWAAEVTLEPGITSMGKPRVDLQQTPRSVLLTGGTGFLGAYLLKELVERLPNVEIQCLVRADSEAAVRERIRTGLRKYKLDAEKILRSVRPLVGDLTQPDFGLGKSGFARLANEVDWIYHNGAAVNFIYPYAALRAANVEGTRNVLRLATETRVKPVHFSSTLAVLLGDQVQAGVIRETDEFDHPERMTSGYGQSKWVAERLIRLAGTRGVPIAIYRPGRITGDSLNGIWNADDLFLFGLNMLLHLGAVPDVDIKLDFTPVDYVASAMIEISRRPESLGGTYHLVNEALVDWASLVVALQQEGYPLRVLSLSAWRREFSEAFGELPEGWISWLTPLPATETVAGGAADQSEDEMQRFSAPRISFDCSETRRRLAGSSISCPTADEHLIRTYIRALIAQELLQPPPVERPG
jgi:amino acid adenylation domain-containing protein/thioester reductase-like protein